MLHAFSRTELLLGEAAMQHLKRCRVAIFGVGGVGSYAAEALVRSGVGHFVLVDDDRVCLTNINRQLHATRKTVGQLKVEVMKARMLEINPAAQIHVHQRFYGPGLADELMEPDWHYILDCIDTVTCKLDLVIEAKKRGIPVISCMGAGNKLDPTRFEVADLSKTQMCPLARTMRKELRKRGVKSLKVVYSQEEVIAPVLSEGASCMNACVCPKGTERTCTTRRQIPGSISFVPAVAGLIMAGEVIKDLIRVGSQTQPKADFD